MLNRNKFLWIFSKKKASAKSVSTQNKLYISLKNNILVKKTHFPFILVEY